LEKERKETLREMMQGKTVSVWIIKILTSNFKINKIHKFHIVFILPDAFNFIGSS